MEIVNLELILQPLNWIIVGLILGFLGLMWAYTTHGKPPPPFNLFSSATAG